MIKRVALLGLILQVAPLSAQDIRDTFSSTQANVTDEMVAAAEAILAALDDPARQSREEMLNIRTDHLRLSMDDENRQNWSYWPRSQYGMLLSLMNTEQGILTHELLSTLLSIKGQLKVTQIMELDAHAFRLKDRRDWDAWRENLHPEGIAVTNLSSEQKTTVQRVVDEVITTYRPEIANSYLRVIDIDELSFA